VTACDRGGFITGVHSPRPFCPEQWCRVGTAVGRSAQGLLCSQGLDLEPSATFSAEPFTGPLGPTLLPPPTLAGPGLSSAGWMLRAGPSTIHGTPPVSLCPPFPGPSVSLFPERPRRLGTVSTPRPSVPISGAILAGCLRPCCPSEAAAVVWVSSGRP
jgi:hypothetical protein